MPAYYPKELIVAVQDLLDTPPSLQAIGITFNQIMNLFQENGIIQTRVEHCSSILPHAKNRGDDAQWV